MTRIDAGPQESSANVRDGTIMLRLGLDDAPRHRNRARTSIATHVQSAARPRPRAHPRDALRSRKQGVRSHNRGSAALGANVTVITNRSTQYAWPQIRPRMRRARRPRMLGATTKAMPVSIVEEERRRRRGPDRTRALRGSAIGLPPRRRPQGWRACVSPLMRVHVSGPPADVAVFMATSTKLQFLLYVARCSFSIITTPW